MVYSSSRGANANLNDENKKEHECGLCHEPAEDNVVSVSIFFCTVFRFIFAGLTCSINIFLCYLIFEGDFL